MSSLPPLTPADGVVTNDHLVQLLKYVVTNTPQLTVDERALMVELLDDLQPLLPMLERDTAGCCTRAWLWCSKRKLQ